MIVFYWIVMMPLDENIVILGDWEEWKGVILLKGEIIWVELERNWCFGVDGHGGLMVFESISEK